MPERSNAAPAPPDADDERPEGDDAFAARLPPLFRALRHRNYRLFVSGQLVSLVGTWMQSVAQAWLVYRLTGSPLLLGAVGFASQVPVFVFASLGGALADRYSRHRILVATQTVAMGLASVLAFLTLTGRMEVWHLFALAAALGLTNAFDIPARQAFVADMVGRGDLGNAIALNSMMFNGARIAGPAVAGVLVATVGEGWCFLINAVSYLGVLAGLLAMRVAPRARVPSGGSALASIAEGFRFAGRTRPILALLLMLGLVGLVGMPYAVLMPLFADRILGGGASALGILMGASGVGALGGALALATRTGIRGLGRWVARAFAGFGVALFAFSFSEAFWLSAALLIPAGFAMMVGMAASNTLVQAFVPDGLRGRVMAVYSMVFMGTAPFGALAAGALAGTLGAPLTVRLGGLVCVAGAAVFALRLPALRKDARRLIVALEAVGGEPSDEANGGAGAAVPRVA